MSTTSRTELSVSSPVAAQPPVTPRQLGPLDVLVLSLWCGLAAGLLEVGARILSRSIDTTYRLYDLSRHFVWLVPLSNLLLFAGIGVLLAVTTRCWPRRGGRLSPRILCALTVLPMFMVAGPQIYSEAWLVLSLGIASFLVPTLERHALGLRRSLMKTLPCLLGIVLVSAGFTFGRDWLKQRRETGRPLPPAASPNVLLIVLDTVRADHMSLYGYGRGTTPTLERLAKQGIRFDGARATAPWTLASHGSIFTGRWPHELGARWLAPLGGNFPTLAEYLGSHGYATAGFVANTFYCSYATGLDRGFTHYDDYDLERLGPFRTARLVDLSLKTIADMVQSLSESLDVVPFRPLQEYVLGHLLVGDKKHAGAINREFVDWLSRRPEPGRPFFAFLNYFDAHTRYVLPEGAKYRFGLKPETKADFQLFERWGEIDKTRLPQRYRTLIVDCYDNCLAKLDERLGELFDELQSPGVLDRTLVIVTADHGEGLGEHDLFDHGESLYRTEVRVPLLVVLPERSQHQGVVRETVSLRDLSATITDLVGLGPGSPFPGRSLAGLWRDTSPEAASDSGVGAISELAASNPANPNQGRSPASRGPLVSLASGDFVYIRNEGDGSEELFDERDDPRELTNRAHIDVMQPLVQRFRARLDQMKVSAMGQGAVAGGRP
jgi:arylsulfatase A-like enzyme